MVPAIRPLEWKARKIMQYTTECTAKGCDYSYRDPSERSAKTRMDNHIEETGHIVTLGGVYDQPNRAGYNGPNGYITYDDDPDLSDMGAREQHEFRRSMEGQKINEKRFGSAD